MKYDWFKSFLELPHGIPSRDTLRRVFAHLDPDEFNKRFFSWIASINPQSRNKKQYDSAIHMVSAWANKAGITLGQVKVDEKSNEITAIPELLDSLDVEGAIVTIDAMGTQTTIAKKIIDSKFQRDFRKGTGAVSVFKTCHFRQGSWKTGKTYILGMR